jgi:ferredoxin
MMRTLHLLLVVMTIMMCGTEAWLTPQFCQKRRSTTRCYAAAPAAADNQDQNEFHTVQVSFEGRSCQISVGSNETILVAMERAGVSRRLAIPGELPSDCRRGNCLTCTGRHADESQKSSLERREDGLSPYMSREVVKRGYVLTCSSCVVGEGLKLELGENHRAWNEMYVARLKEEATQLTGRAAMAKTIRLSDEKNVPRWTVETESALEKSGD